MSVSGWKRYGRGVCSCCEGGHMARVGKLWEKMGGRARDIVGAV